VGLGVKVNMVVKKGLNENQILPMAKYFKEQKITLRFIEFMDVGSSNSWKQEKVISSQDILTILKKHFVLNYMGRDTISEVSEKWQYDNEDVEIGLISSVSKPFCNNCSRARISADGFLYTCLFSSTGVDLKSIVREAKGTNTQLNSQLKGQITENLVKYIYQIWHHREDRYSELRALNTEKPKEGKIEMSYIGG
jgi:cyclic pyranopterin phosphate synthase